MLNLNVVFRPRSLPSLLDAAVTVMVMVAGCGGPGLEQPTSAEPALSLQVRLAQPAAATVRQIALVLAPVPYCPSSDAPGRDIFGTVVARPIPFENLYRSFPALPFDPSATVIALTASSEGEPRSFRCRNQPVPLVRFFQPYLFLSPQPTFGPVVPWTTHDALVAYADDPVTFTTYGPSDEPVSLPRGYSVLRRSCGSADRPWLLQVDSSDDPVDFYPPSLPFYPQPIPLASALLEQSERSLLEGCGIQSPPLDLGTRVSFDHASVVGDRSTTIGFLGDAQTLLYLTPIDPADPAQDAALRSIDLVTGSARQVAIVPDGRRFQTTETGEVYVATEFNLVKVDPRAEGSATVTPIPVPANGLISPDGQRIAYFATNPAPADRPVFVKVWDVATGIAHTIDYPGIVVGWSPASLLVEGEFYTEQSSGNAYALLQPEDGRVVERFVSSSSGGYIGALSWGAEGPIGLSATLPWTPQQPVAPVHGDVLFDDNPNFGLSVEDLHALDVREVLAPSAGSVTFAAAVPGIALVWARRCLGLFETVCTFELHLVRLPAGRGHEDQVVAVADSAAPVALSPSGHRFAIAARDGIYVRDLP